MRRLLHIGLHDKINRNAGDTCLFWATRAIFDHFLGPSEWVLHQLWEPFNAAYANEFDGVVVGGGGLLLAEQDGASYTASGWQWNCRPEELTRLDVPLVVFGIGWNQFPGQPDFAPHFYPHIQMVIDQAAFFGMREMPGIDRLSDALARQGFPHRDIHWQPCPTTCLWQLCPDLQRIRYVNTLGINMAGDRLGLRLNSARPEALYCMLLDVACRMDREGWVIVPIFHKDVDRAILDTWQTRGDLACENLTDADPATILDAYANMTMVLGMRGHAQLIPLGLRRGIVSLITHDKLTWFLRDIQQTGWGVAWQDATAEMLLELCHLQMRMSAQRAAAQQQCYTVTTQNMQRIGAILGAEMLA